MLDSGASTEKKSSKVMQSTLNSVLLHNSELRKQIRNDKQWIDLQNNKQSNFIYV